MAEFSQNQRRKTLAILVGGGPAPGINGVIRSVTNEALGAGMRVLGIMEGFRWLAQGDGTRVRELDYDAVSGIHFDGGSVLRTSRTNPASKPETLEATVRALTELGVDYLVTIGGDDTASSAMKIEKAGIKIGIAHVPKTIDNDLPLPGHMPTFGYETARAAGVDITQAMMVDAETTNRWYYLVSMGRKAGHLALGIGKAAGATLTIIGEEFRNERVSLRTICDILESSHIKRMAHGRPYGVAILAEGLVESIDPHELGEYAELERDEHGNIRYSEVELGRIVKSEVRRRLRERGLDQTIVHKDIGYELRCASPIPFDLEYTQDLGYAAVQYLLSGRSGAIVTIDRGRLIPIPFDTILDKQAGRARIREVDIDSDSYRVARHYMIRVKDRDFQDAKTVARLAVIGNMTPEAFESQFKYLINDPPVLPEDVGASKNPKAVDTAGT